MLSHCPCCCALSCAICLFSLGRLCVFVFFSHWEYCIFLWYHGREQFKCLCCMCLSLFLSVCISPSECICVWVTLWGSKVFMLHRASICLSCNKLHCLPLSDPPITLSHSLVWAARRVDRRWVRVNRWLQHLENIHGGGERRDSWAGQVKGK